MPEGHISSFQSRLDARNANEGSGGPPTTININWKHFCGALGTQSSISITLQIPVKTSKINIFTWPLSELAL